jgi:hypothetical protein
MDEALELLEKNRQIRKKSIILSSQSWHVGVLGYCCIKAGRKNITDLYILL